MASGDILATYRKLYRKIGEEFDVFKQHEAQLTSLMRTISNVVLRLPVLQEPRNFGELRDVPGLCDRVLASQMLGLDQLMTSARREAADLGASAAAGGRVAREGRSLRQRNKALSSSAAGDRAVGPIPSVADCVRGLQDIADMMERQARLMQALLEAATPDTDAAEWPHLLAAAQASICVNRRKVSDLLYVMEQTEEKRRL